MLSKRENVCIFISKKFLHICANFVTKYSLYLHFFLANFFLCVGCKLSNKFHECVLIFFKYMKVSHTRVLIKKQFLCKCSYFCVQIILSVCANFGRNAPLCECYFFIKFFCGCAQFFKTNSLLCAC